MIELCDHCVVLLGMVPGMCVSVCDPGSTSVWCSEPVTPPSESVEVREMTGFRTLNHLDSCVHSTENRTDTPHTFFLFFPLNAPQCPTFCVLSSWPISEAFFLI